MNENYYGISRLQFDKYFENLSMKYKNHIMDLLDTLSTKIQFTLKKISTQFHMIKENEKFDNQIINWIEEGYRLT